MGSMQRVFILGLAAIACVNGGQAGAQVSRTVNFGDNPDPVTLAASSLEVTVQPSKPDDDGLITTRFAIRAPGFQSTIIDAGDLASAGYDRWVGIVKLSAADPVPSTLVQSFSGGAHCCATLTAIVPLAGRFKALEFEAIDGDIHKALPVDLDGDGILDIVRQDDSFRYQFSSGAGSFSPPRIFNVYKGQIVDVSHELGFRPIWQRFAAQTLTRCKDKSDGDRNGACAAYAAAGARLGRYETAFKEAVALANPKGELPTFCKVDLVNYQCPKGREITFYTFQTALAYFLRKEGYVD